jgi:hypothetical protein
MDGPGKTSGASSARGPIGSALSPEKLAEAARLRAIDHQVRAHEQAHVAAAGPYNPRYAVAGEVQDDPQATVRKMITVIAAANAPADPSPADRAVAAQAAQALTQAQADLVRRTYAEPDGPGAQRGLVLQA